MTNPTPRPALRKAADAEVHPAAPRPARSARASAAASEPAPAPRPAAQPTSSTSRGTTKGSPRSTGKVKPGNPARGADASDASADADAPVATAIGPSPRPRSATTSATRSARSRGLRPVPPKAPASGKAPRRFSGSTSDHLRPEPDPEVPSTKGRGARGDGATTKPAKKKTDLMKGRSTELGVRVPKALRKAARSRAKAEGLDLDTVVIDLLHDWVTRRR